MTTATQTQPYITRYSDAADYLVAGERARILADSSKTNGSLSLVHLTVNHGESAPLHVHRHHDESLFILHGELRGVCGETTWTATGGSFIWLPRGANHTYQGMSEMPTEVLVITVPGGFDAFVAEAGEPFIVDAGNPVVPLNLARLAEIAARHDIEVVGPPLDFPG